MAVFTFVGRYMTDLPLVDWLGMHLPISEDFMPYQVVTHMFMHSDQTPFHLLFNMLMLWMIGSQLEMALGAKRFLGLYIAAGLGACALHVGISWWEYHQMEVAAQAFFASPTQDGFELFLHKTHLSSTLRAVVVENFNWDHPDVMGAVGKQVDELLAQNRNIPMVGASGAIFGLLATFGLMFPETQFVLLFPPIPVRAKYMVPILIALELFYGISNAGASNVAHFAHLGGALVGMAAVWLWRGKHFS